MGQGRRSAGVRVEAWIQVVIMLAIGGAAGAASFTHVHAVAAAHGQGGWLAWADAVVLELMSVASGLELRRRRRGGMPVGFPIGVLVCAVLLSLAAQVVQAEPSVIGWVAAGLPALGFLVMVKIALADHPEREEPDSPHEPDGPAGAHGDDGAGRMGAEPVPGDDGPSVGTGQACRGEVSAGPDMEDVMALLPAARAARDALVADGVSVSRQALARQLRSDGHRVSNAKASILLREVDGPTLAAGVPAPP